MRCLLYILSLMIVSFGYCDDKKYEFIDSAEGRHVTNSKMIKLKARAHAFTDDVWTRKIKIKIAYKLTCLDYPEKFQHAVESKVFTRVSNNRDFEASFEIGHFTDGAAKASGYAMTNAWDWLSKNPGKTIDCMVQYGSVVGFSTHGIHVTIDGGFPIMQSFNAGQNQMSGMRSNEIKMYSQKSVDANSGENSEIGNYACTFQNGNCGDSPLIIDLAQNGIHLGKAGTGVLFDINNVGELTPIQWVKINGDEAFLVRDLNNNGQIDDGGELFGTGAFMLQSAEIGKQNNERAANGFVALAQYDQVALGGNDDGYITAADAIWQELSLWRDSNADAFTDVDEIITLEQVGITHLEIIPKLSNRTDPAGNQIPFWSWSLDKTEQKHKRYKMVDVFFQRLQSPN